MQFLFKKHILSRHRPPGSLPGQTPLVTITIILAAFVSLVLLLVVRTMVQMTGSAAAVPRGTSSVPGMQGYLALRDRVLQGTRSGFGLAAGATIGEPWGIVVDMFIDNGYVTVAALADGSAGTYLSGSSGMSRGRSQESVRAAARLAVQLALPCQPLMRVTNSYPLPDRGEVAFYALTDLGVFAAIVTEAQLGAPMHPFAGLAQAAQNVITQYRLSRQPQSG